VTVMVSLGITWPEASLSALPERLDFLFEGVNSVDHLLERPRQGSGRSVWFSRCRPPAPRRGILPRQYSDDNGVFRQ